MNTTPGGKVYRLDASGQFIDCGHPGAEKGAPEVQPYPRYFSGRASWANSLVCYHGDLFVTSTSIPGVYKYKGERAWEDIGPSCRLLTLLVFKDNLYGLSTTAGGLLRYEGDSNWTACGMPPGNVGQPYSSAVHKGSLFVGTWPDALVYRYEGPRQWSRVGATGYEMETMGMALYNGKVYAGSLPMANIWRMDPHTKDGFTFMGNIDNSPVMLRRAWSMAVCEGKLFAGSFPSGRVHSFEAGKMATWDKSLSAGWRHIAAVCNNNRLTLYVDGISVAKSSEFNSAGYESGNAQPLLIGFGSYEHFCGSMSDLRLYNCALEEAEVGKLAEAP